MGTVIDYKPPPTIKRFMEFHKRKEFFQAWITGPVGSGKTTANFFKLAYLAAHENPDPDGIRRTKAVIVRNTMPQLKDTTIASWNYWFRDGIAGVWKETEKKFTLIYPGVECEVLFRALDTPDDITRVLSLEVNFAIIDEFVQIPYQIIEALSGRVGRFKRPDGTKPSVYGMWGASNPDTEDNWWHDYLHRVCTDPSRNMPPDDVARYFKQPSGLSPDVENLENLPDNYYTNLLKGKSQAWIKQYIEGEWGFSIAGQPVIPTFSRKRHIKKGLEFDPKRPLVVGADPGLGGSAFVFLQQDVYGCIRALGELCNRGISTNILLEQHLKPYLAANFPNARVIIALDPAGSIRASTDGKTHYKIIQKEFDVWSESNNRFPLRLNAIEHFTTKAVGDNEGLLIDPDRCPRLVRALSGGWRYEMHPKKDMLRRDVAEDNEWTHVGDAFGYGCRYFHKGIERDIRYKLAAATGGFAPPKRFGTNYHVR